MPSNKNTFYISTAIAYTNGKPHIGFAMELIQADAIARYKRLKGYDTWFLTGTDEHGIKNYNTAKEKGVDTLDFVNQNAKAFKSLKDTLDISYDDFIQTTDQKRHWPAAQKLWKRLEANDDIYMKEYEGLYCEGCEAFLKEVDLVDGNCETHKKPPVRSTESNYFFKLSKYSEKIVQLIESGELEIKPESRQNEFLTLAKSGLHDVSFSRPKSSLPWGIPVPEDEDHTMYVWCDALTNYVSALGYADESEKFKSHWPADVHLIGKDIVRFHAGIWIGMLLSAKLELPKSILIHGFVTHNGEKMSKSIGNVVDPVEVVNEHGKDSLRYYLLREIPMGKDGDFSDKLFLERHNSDLANNLGNLLNRVHTLITRNEVKNFVLASKGNKYEKKVEETYKKYIETMDDYQLNEAVFAVWKLVDFANKQMEEEKPWSQIKDSPEKGAETLMNLAEVLRHISQLIAPIMPESSQKMRNQLGLTQDFNLKDSTKWGSQTQWENLGERAIIFPRIDIV